MEAYSFTNSNSIGPGHEENQDSYLVDKENAMFAVADGVGGYLGGKIASKLAIDILEERAGSISDEKSMSKVLEHINSAIIRKADELNYHMMGTTIVAAKIINGSIVIGNVGDSAAILFSAKGGEAVAVYTDDSLRSKDPENMWQITQCMGMMSKPHTRTEKLKRGDTLLLASDGITDNLNINEIKKLIRNKNPSKEIVSAAIASGRKKDDATAVCIKL